MQCIAPPRDRPSCKESPSDDYDDDYDDDNDDDDDDDGYDDQEEQLTMPIWAKESPQVIAETQKESVQQDTPTHNPNIAMYFRSVQQQDTRIKIFSCILDEFS